MLCRYTDVSHREETHTITHHATNRKRELLNQPLPKDLKWLLAKVQNQQLKIES